jgi:hypothetical protein
VAEILHESREAIDELEEFVRCGSVLMEDSWIRQREYDSIDLPESEDGYGRFKRVDPGYGIVTRYRSENG